MVKFSPGCGCCNTSDECEDPITSSLCTDSGFDAADTLEVKFGGGWWKWLAGIPVGPNPFNPPGPIWFETWLEMSNCCHDYLPPNPEIPDQQIRGDERCYWFEETLSYEKNDPVFGAAFTFVERFGGVFTLTLDGGFSVRLDSYEDYPVGHPRHPGGTIVFGGATTIVGTVDGPAEVCATFDSDGFTVTEAIGPFPQFPPPQPDGTETTEIRVQ